MTTSPNVSTDIFSRLAPPLQRALWELGWQGLRDNQIAALPLILGSQDHVVISAATAAAKTEAAFLPLLTRLWQGQSVGINARQSTDELIADALW